jgi:hypothetical protein
MSYAERSRPPARRSSDCQAVPPPAVFTRSRSSRRPCARHWCATASPRTRSLSAARPTSPTGPVLPARSTWSCLTPRTMLGSSPSSRCGTSATSSSISRRSAAYSPLAREPGSDLRREESRRLRPASWGRAVSSGQEQRRRVRLPRAHPTPARRVGAARRIRVSRADKRPRFSEAHGRRDRRSDQGVSRSCRVSGTCRGY